MTIFDKIYGQQSFIVASKLVPVSSQIQPYLQCLQEFRKTYVQHHLNRVFQSDTVLHQLLTKKGNRELASDLEVHCSLSFNLAQETITEQLLALLITVDAVNVLRVYLQLPDRCELLFKLQLKWANPDDYAQSCDFFLRAKAIVIVSKIAGQAIVITHELKIRNCFGEGQKFNNEQGNDQTLDISRIEIFEYRDEEFFALGLRDGTVVVKPSGAILTNSVAHHIVPPEDDGYDDHDSNDKVTFVAF